MASHPVDGDVGIAERRIYEWEDALQSLPAAQFARQVWRERYRLEYQRANKQAGRKQTLPYDNSLDLETNAQNNVRNRWKEQGIWSSSWGKDPSSPVRPGPTSPVAAWAHEVGKRPGTSASRPLRQFSYQVSKELEWLMDEKMFRESGGRTPEAQPTAVVACDRIKALWIKDKIWDTRWSDTPGIKWKHENFDVRPIPANGEKARAKRKRDISPSHGTRVAVSREDNQPMLIQLEPVQKEQALKQKIDEVIPTVHPIKGTRRMKPAAGAEGDGKHSDRNGATKRLRPASGWRHKADREVIQAFLVQAQVGRRCLQAEEASRRPKRRVGGMRMVFRDIINLYHTKPSTGNWAHQERRRMVWVF